jgi:Domain of unknown function (DUF4328)
MSDNTKVTHTFSSGHLITTLLTLFLLLCVLIDLISIGFGYSRIAFLSRVVNEEAILPSDLTAEAERQQLVGALLIAAYVIAGVVFLIWLYRAHRNKLALASRGGRYSSSWSILLFFVPIVNLYYSYDIFRELWKQSNPDAGLSDAFLKQHASTHEQYSSKTALIGVWWGSVIASGVLARTSATLAAHATTISDLVSQSWTGMISDALGIVSAITLIVLVNRIDSRLEEKHRRRTLDVAAQQVGA